jgi:hypothetical protein
MSVEEIEHIEVCEDCFFYKASRSGQHGYCRESPPVFTSTDESGRPRFYSPVVSPWGWCGRWEGIND